ncbi:MAG: hypothetical protein ACFFA5_04060 [Promethearchaeota archaeon]
MQSPAGPYYIVRCSSCSKPQIYLLQKKYAKSRKKTCPFCGKNFTIHLEQAIAGFSTPKLARSFLLNLTEKERLNEAES